MAQNMNNIIISGYLDSQSIDNMSQGIIKILKEEKINSKDIQKIRLCIEASMGIWATEIGENAECHLIKKQRLGKTILSLEAIGQSVNPTQYQDELLLSVSDNPNITKALGYPTEYKYIEGWNKLIIRTKTKNQGPMGYMLFAIVLAILLSFSLRLFAQDIGTSLDNQLIAPLLDTLMNALRLISGPLVFFSIISGITGMEDITSIGKVGKTLIRRFLVITLVLATLLWLSVSYLFPITLSGNMMGEGVFEKILQLFLDIIPGDIVTPFQTGNAMQIIFIGTSLGLTLIFLGDTVNEAVKIINQLNAAIQHLMSAFGKIMPFLIFLCISNLILTSKGLSDLSLFFIPFGLITLLDIVLPFLYGVYASFSTGVSYRFILKSQMETVLLALTTASSAGAFGSNVNCCENKLGMDKHFVRFAIPFGQILFMPGAVIHYLILPLYLAKLYEIPITPGFILTLLVVSSILAIASPPVPGGPLLGSVILLTQFGIPTEAMAICATVLTLVDYTSTACNIACLQQELLIDAKKLSLLTVKSNPD